MRSIYKIIHTTCHTGWGKIERRIFNESVWMTQQGHQVIIVAPRESPLFNKARHQGLKVFPLQFKPIKIISDYKQLVRLFANEKPNILNTHGNADSKIALKAARKSGIPCRILSRHTPAPVKNSWYNRKIYKQFSHYVFTDADLITRHLKSVFDLKGTCIFSMPSGIIEPEDLIPQDKAKKKLTEQLGVDPETKFIGYVGPISPDADVDFIIKTFKKIKSKLPQHHLVIVGDGSKEYLAELRSQNDRAMRHRIHFTGFENDTWTYYRAFDCNLCISIDSIPQSLFEAMYASCPVIGPRRQNMTEIITHGKNGLLFETNQTDSLAGTIMESIVRKPAALKRVHAARELVKKDHTIDVMGRNIIRIYRLHQVQLEKQLMSN